MKRRKLKRKKTLKIKFFFFFSLFIISLYFTFKYLEKKNISINNKELVNILLSKSNNNIIKTKENHIIDKVISVISNPVNIINNNYKGLVKEKETVRVDKVIDNVASVYIYNTHQSETYQATTFLEYSVNPNVMIASFILKEKLKESNINSIVEERSIKEYLNINNFSYAHSYDASRSYMESIKKDNPSLKYFIDVHRDSLSRDKTTVEINGKSYAKIVFLIGLENPTYQDNLAFTTKINDKLNSLYPGLSKGIYKKGGEGVNGVYNQDFSPYTILIEIGGEENTIDEVLNSTMAFKEAFIEVINTNEG